MNMGDLYTWMKEALKFFGLAFADMDEVTMWVEGTEGKQVIVMEYDGIRISLPLSKPETQQCNIDTRSKS